MTPMLMCPHYSIVPTTLYSSASDRGGGVFLYGIPNAGRAAKRSLLTIEQCPRLIGSHV